MGRFVIISALLLGLIGAVSGQYETTGWYRPKYPLHPNEGCVPGQQSSMDCPPRMECLLDSNYPNGGKCQCKKVQSNINSNHHKPTLLLNPTFFLIKILLVSLFLQAVQSGSKSQRSFHLTSSNMNRMVSRHLTVKIT